MSQGSANGMTGDGAHGRGKIRVLVVDDEPIQIESIARGLFLYGYEVSGAPDVAAALEHVYGRLAPAPDVIVTDLTMPRGTGFDLIKIVRAFSPALPIVVITGLNATPEAEELSREGIPVLAKPFDPAMLDRDIRAVLAARGDGIAR